MAVAQVLGALNHGGMERVAVTVANGLHRRGWRSHVIGTRALGPMEAELDPGVARFCVGRSGRFDVAGWWRMARYVDEHRIDVLHAHNSHSAGLCRVVRQLTRTRPTVVMHDHSGGMIGRPVTRAERLLLGRLDAVIAVADGLEARAVAMGVPPERCHVVINGIDDVPAAPDPDPRPTVVHVANLQAPKGHDVAMGAAARVRARHPNLHWICVGRVADPPTDYVRQVMALRDTLGLHETVTFTGLQRDVLAYWRRAHVGVLSSDAEALPIVVLESFSQAVPVVMTDVGQAPGLIRAHAAGAVVPPRDPDALGDAVSALLDDPAAARAAGARGRALFEAQLTSARMVDRVEAILRSVR